MSAVLDPIAPQSSASLAIDAPAAGGHILMVGAGQEFADLSQAIAAASDNDVIAVLAGTYVDQSNYTFRNVVTARNVTIEGVGGIAHLVMGAQGLANGKGLLDAQNGLTVKNFELSGANDQGTGGAVPGGLYGNVAGIRIDSGSLTLVDVYIHDNQEGVLGGTAGSVVTIDHSAFVNNGSGDGYSHGIYIGGADSLTLTNSYFSHANVGHEIKSRAASTTIANNVIADGATGTASYDIDIPNAGDASITGNVIEKGPLAQNAGIIHYGGETQFNYVNNSLNVIGNTIVNDDPAYNVGVVWNQSATNGYTAPISLTGNTIYNVPNVGTGAIASSGNSFLTVPQSSEPAYSTALPTASAPVIAPPTGRLSLTLTRSGFTLSGGSTGATILDTAGGNTISSGAVGITLVEQGAYASIATTAGTRNAITLADRNNLTSAGNDAIALSGLYSTIEASGASAIHDSSATDFNAYRLDGAETLTVNGAANVTVGAGAAATVVNAATGQSNVAKLAGSTLTVRGTLADGTASVTVSGAAATAAASGNGVSVAGGATDAGAVTVTFGGGTIKAASGEGADTYVFVAGIGGNDTINGFRNGVDTLTYQGFTGAAVTSSVVSNGSTVIGLADGTAIILAGVVLTGTSTGAGTGAGPGGGGSGTGIGTGTGTAGSGGTSGGQPAPSGTVTLTGTKQTVRGDGTRLTVVDQAGGNTVIGGTGGVNATLGGDDALSTVAGATDTVIVGREDTVTSAGNDLLTTTQAYSKIVATGTSTVDLLYGPNTLTGGAGNLTVLDGGGNTIVGGSGGLIAKVRGYYSFLTTAVGSTNSIDAVGRTTVTSNGNDTIGIEGDYSAITANGAATIVESGYNVFTLNGPETLTANGDAVATIGPRASVGALVAAGASLIATLVSGGRLTVTQGLTGGGSGSVTVSGSAARITSSAGGTFIYGDATGTAALTVSFGSGVNTATAGFAPVTYAFVAGHGGGADTIEGFRPGVDTLSFQGFATNPVASWRAVGGNTYGQLSDGTTIVVAGASVASPVYAGAGQASVVQTYTHGNSAWTGGAANESLVDASGGGNNFAGGIGGLTIRLVDNDTVSTWAGATDAITAGNSDVVRSAGNDTILVGGRYNDVIATGTSRVLLTNGGNALTGGAGRLTANDNFGNVVNGGAGGLDVTETGTYGVIRTAAGSSNTIAAASRTNIVSAGTDAISLNGDYSSVTASGAATITEVSGYNSLTLTGNATVMVGGTAVVLAGATSQTTLRLGGGGDAQVTRMAGSSTTLVQSTKGGVSTTVVSGGAGSLEANGNGVAITTVAGASTTIGLGAASANITANGDDTITAGSGSVAITAGRLGGARLGFTGGSGAVSITLGSGTLTAVAGSGALTVQFGSGSAQVHGGSAADTYRFVGGQGGGTDTIAGYRAGIDQLQFGNFGASPIAGQSAASGNLTLSLTDGTKVILLGVSHT